MRTTKCKCGRQFENKRQLWEHLELLRPMRTGLGGQSALLPWLSAEKCERVQEAHARFAVEHGLVA